MKWCLCITFIFSSFLIQGQVKKLNYLEILYDQGHYRKVYKKSKRLLKTESLTQKNTFLLFHSLSEFMLSQEQKKYSFDNAIKNYKTISSADSDLQIRTTYGNYIHDLKSGLINQIIIHKEKGKRKQAEKLLLIYNDLFKNDVITLEKVNLSITNSTTIPSGKETHNQIINYAKKFLGVPYVYGGSDNKGFDCSGYTKYVFSHFGFTIPRTADQQSKYLKKIKIKHIQKGDLLFFGKHKQKITHVGIAINEKDKSIEMIHASSSKGISTTSVTNNSYWKPKLQFAGRIIE